MKKLLVYLDQSYVSSMAKETLSKTRPEHATVGVAMGRLLAVLRELVERDKVLCPLSILHYQETGFDDRIERAAYRILKELADGVSFHTYREIEFRQTLRAMRRYLGLQAEPEDGRWQHALTRDPHRSMRRPRVYVHIPWHHIFTEDDRRRKALMQDFRMKRYAPGESAAATFADCRAQQMQGVVRVAYLQPCLDFLTKVAAIAAGTNPLPAITEASSLQEVLDWLEAAIPPPGARLFAEYFALTSSIPDERFLSFFESPEFDAVPFHDINCSLNAGFLFYKPQRRPRPSDPYDIFALASALPYVDMVTTDSAMKDMLRQLGLDKKYGVEVYSSRLADVEALCERLSHLT